MKYDDASWQFNAKDQAEFEYAGTTVTWQAAGQEASGGPANQSLNT